MKRRTVLTGAAATAALATTGCMGKFALTTGLYGWNEKVTGNKLVNNLIFWGLNLLPVYELAVTVDLLILNVIEFWTGSNLMALKDAPDAPRVALRGEHLEISHRGETFTATQVDPRTVIVRRGHLVLGAAVVTEKGLVITGPDGVESAAFSHEDIETIDRALTDALG
jgi:hypothetical protein